MKVSAREKKKNTSQTTKACNAPRSDLERNLVDEVTDEVNVVTRHDHLLIRRLGPLREGQPDRDVRSPDKQLRPVVVHEGGVTTPFLLGEDVARRFKLLDGLDGARGGDDHAALDLLALDAAEQGTHVVAGLAAVELLVEHLDTCEGGGQSPLSLDLSLEQKRVQLTGEGSLERRAHADNLDFGTLGDGTTLDTARDDGSAALDRKDVLDRHQERLLEVARRLVEPVVDGVHQLDDRVLANLVIARLERRERRTFHDRGLFAVKAVRRQQVAHLHLDELEHLGVVDLVDLVDVDDELLDADLLGEEQVLARLRHLAVRSGNDNDTAVPVWPVRQRRSRCHRISQHSHLGGTGDHVLDVIGVTRAIDVGVVAVAAGSSL
jgi:hypothetical protein